MTEFARTYLFACLTLVLGVVTGVIALQYPAASSGFPRAIALFLVVLAVVDLVRSARERSRVTEFGARDAEFTARQLAAAALAVFLSAPVYVGLATLFDFEVATFVYLFAGMVLLGNRNPILIATVSIGVLLTVKALFFVLLDVTRSPTLLFGS